MRPLKKRKSEFSIDYKFKYNDKAKEQYFSYKVPFEEYDEAVRAYFRVYDVELDGTGTDIYNALSSLGAISSLEESAYFEDYLSERCREDAFEEFKIQYELEHEDDEEEDK